MNKRLGVLAVAAAAMVWIGVSAQQEMLPRPGPGSGVTPVRIVNEGGVTLAGTPEVRVAVAVPVRLPSFAVKGRSLVVTWPNGESERVMVADVLEDGWIGVEGGRFVNLSAARSVQTGR